MCEVMIHLSTNQWMRMKRNTKKYNLKFVMIETQTTLKKMLKPIKFGITLDWNMRGIMRAELFYPESCENLFL